MSLKKGDIVLVTFNFTELNTTNTNLLYLRYIKFCTRRCMERLYMT